MEITCTQKELVKILKKKKKKIGKYQFLLADTFENFQNMSFEKYELDSARFSLIKE